MREQTAAGTRAVPLALACSGSWLTTACLPSTCANGGDPSCPPAHTCGSVQYSVRRLERVTTVASAARASPPLPLPPPPPLPAG